MVRTAVQERLAEVFEPQQARVLAEVMVEAYDDLVKAGDFNELKGIVRELATAQQRTEEHLRGLTLRMDALATAQHRTELRLEELTTQVQELVTWQRGEAGRRDGERYEQFLAKRAFVLFNGGDGGTLDQPVLQQWLREQLRALPEGVMLVEEEDPSLADLIWWKGEQYVVVEASLRVNGKDVLRAARRAVTLQQAKVQAKGLVVGDTWVGEEPRKQAEERGVEWKVGEDLSEGFLAFCRLPR